MSVTISLIPAFKIGAWNSWILMLIFVFFRILLTGKVSQKTEGRINRLINGDIFLLLIYSIFLPLPLGTVWFYLGITAFLLGTVLFGITGLPWASTPSHRPVTKGIYRYSRHPYYIALLVQLIGIGIASASWIFLLFSVLLIVPMNVLMGREEAFCIETYGEAYREYMERTPRWIRIPKPGDGG